MRITSLGATFIQMSSVISSFILVSLERIYFSDHFCSWISQVLCPIFSQVRHYHNSTSESGVQFIACISQEDNLVRIPECIAYGNDVVTIISIINIIDFIVDIRRQVHELREATK